MGASLLALAKSIYYKHKSLINLETEDSTILKKIAKK